MPFTPEEFRRRFGIKPQTTSPFQRNLLWAYQTAKEVVKQPQGVDPALYKQAYGYVKAGLGIETGQRLGEVATSRLLYEEGYKFAGWSRSVRQGLAARGLQPGVEGFVSEWNRLALTERLATSVRRGPYEDIGLRGFYRDIGYRAKQAGIVPELVQKLGPGAPQMLQDILNPPTIGQRIGRGFRTLQGAFTGFEGGFFSRAGLKRIPLPAYIGAGLLGLYLTKPLSLFSGKDDNYNTIEGIPHGGMAERLRKLNTDFGSGWRGLLALPKILQPLVKQRGMSMTPTRLAEFLGSKVSTETERGALKSFITRAQRATTEEVAVFNPMAIRSAAEKQGVQYRKALKGTVTHEIFHQRMAEAGLRGELNLPFTMSEQWIAKYGSKGVASEEYIAYALESSFVDPKNKFAKIARKHYREQIKPALDLASPLEGFLEQGLSGKQRKWFGFGSGGIGAWIRGMAGRLFKMNQGRGVAALTQKFSPEEAKMFFGHGPDVIATHQLAPATKALEIRRDSLIKQMIANKNAAAKKIKDRAPKKPDFVITAEEMNKIPNDEWVRKMGDLVGSESKKVDNLLAKLEQVNMSMKGKPIPKSASQTLANAHRQGVPNALSQSLRPGRRHTFMGNTNKTIIR